MNPDSHDKLMATEARVEAARQLVTRWREQADSLLTHSRASWLRGCADDLASVLDPPPVEEPAVRMTCRCGVEIDVFQRNGIVDVAGPLSEHFETCPAVES